MTGLDDRDIVFVRYVGQAKDRRCLPYFIAVDRSTHSVGKLVIIPEARVRNPSRSLHAIKQHCRRKGILKLCTVWPVLKKFCFSALRRNSCASGAIAGYDRNYLFLLTGVMS